MNKSFKAFTILELVVVLIVGSITIAIATYSLLIVTKLVSTHQNKQIEDTNKLKLIHEVKRDFFLCDQIENTKEDQLDFIFPSSTITYILLGNSLVRQNGTVIDSLPLKNATWEVHKNQAGLVDEISITNNLKDNYNFTKEYNVDYDWTYYKSQNHEN